MTIDQAIFTNTGKMAKLISSQITNLCANPAAKTKPLQYGERDGCYFGAGFSAGTIRVQMPVPKFEFLLSLNESSLSPHFSWHCCLLFVVSIERRKKLLYILVMS